MRTSRGSFASPIDSGPPSSCVLNEANVDAMLEQADVISRRKLQQPLGPFFLIAAAHQVGQLMNSRVFGRKSLVLGARANERLTLVSENAPRAWRWMRRDRVIPTP